MPVRDTGPEPREAAVHDGRVQQQADEHDARIRGQGGQHGQPGRGYDSEYERSHSERSELHREVDEEHHRLEDPIVDGDDRERPVGREPRQGHAEQQREHDDRQHVAGREGGDRVGRHPRHDAIGQGRGGGVCHGVAGRWGQVRGEEPTRPERGRESDPQHHRGARREEKGGDRPRSEPSEGARISERGDAHHERAEHERDDEHADQREEQPSDPRRCIDERRSEVGRDQRAVRTEEKPEHHAGEHPPQDAAVERSRHPQPQPRRFGNGPVMASVNPGSWRFTNITSPSGLKHTPQNSLTPPSCALRANV